MGRELKKSIPIIREQEGNEKNPFLKFGNGKGMKKIHSHNSGMGIRGYHSQEYPGTGTGMKLDQGALGMSDPYNWPLNLIQHPVLTPLF